MPFPPYSNDYPESGNIDYDLFVIDSGNEDSAMYQIRGCIKDALEVLVERISRIRKEDEMITMETLNEVVRTIYGSGNPKAKMLANEAALYFNTAIACQIYGIDRAMKYYGNEKREDLYNGYLPNDPMES